MKSALNTGAPAVSNNNRRQPQRSVRSTALRPSNYYAKPSGFRGAPDAHPEPQVGLDAAPGFFPAITHFTDGISALPKEVIRHLTMLRETEGKAYPHEQAIDELVDAIDKLPTPPRAAQLQLQAFLNFSLANSANASANVSMIDGFTSHPQTANDEQVASSQVALDEPSERRRLLFSQLRVQLQQIVHVLDEKNHVLTTANETLVRQLTRLSGTMPYIEAEISEEARLGSNTHWALPHMKELRKAAAPPPTERSRRDILTANNLAAAAAAVHEGDIAATRSEARREAMLAKRTRHVNVDSDFDDRTTARKAQPGKVRKAQEALADNPKTVTGGAATAQGHKRRRVEKLPPPALERSASTINGRAKGVREPGSPRETPATEVPKKKSSKPLPAPVVPRKRQAVDPPSIAASSPKRGTFATLNRDHSPAPSVRAFANSRMRQDSVQSLVQDNTRGRPPTKAKVTNGAPVLSPEPIVANGGHEADHTFEAKDDVDTELPEDTIAPEANANMLKREDTEPAETVGLDERQIFITTTTASVPIVAAHSRGGSDKPSKPGTPVGATSEPPAPAATATLSRSRSTRNAANGNGSGSNSSNSNNAAASSPAPAFVSMAAPTVKRSHKKGASGRNTSITAMSTTAPSHSSHEPKPRRSPIPSTETPAETIPARKTRGATAKVSPPIADADIPPTLTDDDEEENLHEHEGASPVKGAQLAVGIDTNDETLEDEELADADADEDEPRYCICGGVSYGDMIACDNEACPREWFHLQCVGLTKAPAGKAKWFCDECREMGKRDRMGVR